MSQANPHSLARILAAPWHQRRNAGSLWGFAVVVALCFAAPVVLFVFSLFMGHGFAAEKMRTSAGGSVWVGVGALVMAGWAIFVGNMLQQNHPTLARLVPHHAAQLRVALLVGWAATGLAAAAVPGLVFGAPLAWACATGASLLLFAAALRWPLLWLGGIAAPFVVGWLTRRLGTAEIEEALLALWDAHQQTIACLLLAAGIAVLVAMVRGGGRQHMVAYQRRQRLRKAILEQPGGGTTLVSSRWGWIAGLAVDGRPYGWWMARLLARRDSPVMARLLVGLGPATHWTTRVFQGFWYLVVSLAVCAVASLFIGGDMLAYVLPWLAFSVLTGICTPALQAVTQLQQTRREQALLVLLPGVPRGARLNRWLAWEMSASYLVSAGCAIALAWALDAVADAIRPGISVTATGGMTFGIAAVLLPQVAWQWRRWARLYGSAGSVALAPTITPILMGLGVMGLHVATGLSYASVAITLAIVSTAYCAWRWVRMGGEPTAFPVGRLS